MTVLHFSPGNKAIYAFGLRSKIVTPIPFSNHHEGIDLHRPGWFTPRTSQVIYFSK
jgi:hypothetical protein